MCKIAPKILSKLVSDHLLISFMHKIMLISGLMLTCGVLTYIAGAWVAFRRFLFFVFLLTLLFNKSVESSDLFDLADRTVPCANPVNPRLQGI